MDLFWVCLFCVVMCFDKITAVWFAGTLGGAKVEKVSEALVCINYLILTVAAWIGSTSSNSE